MRKILLRNAASEILNREHGIFLLADKRKKDPAAFRFILQRILQKAADNVKEVFPAAAEHARLRKLRIQHHLLLVCQ